MLKQDERWREDESSGRQVREVAGAKRTYFVQL